VIADTTSPSAILMNIQTVGSAFTSWPRHG
jgi:hypothetical protein